MLHVLLPLDVSERNSPAKETNLLLEEWVYLTLCTIYQMYLFMFSVVNHKHHFKGPPWGWLDRPTGVISGVEPSLACGPGAGVLLVNWREDSSTRPEGSVES